MAAPQIITPDLDDDDEGHDCLEHIDTFSWTCKECGEAICPGDAECTWCGGFPCRCDAAYEALKDRELGL